MKDVELFNDHFQNYKTYGIPKAQLIIADIPYNIGKNAYGSNPSWYIDGDNSNGESELLLKFTKDNHTGGFSFFFWLFNEHLATKMKKFSNSKILIGIEKFFSS